MRVCRHPGRASISPTNPKPKPKNTIKVGQLGAYIHGEEKPALASAAVAAAAAAGGGAGTQPPRQDESDDGDGADGGGEGDAGAEEAVCVKSGVLLKAGKAKFNLRYFELLGSGMLNYKKKETDTELTGSIELSATVRHFLARSFTFLAVLSYFCTHRSEHSCIVSPLENVCGERFRALDLT